ncbi:thiamine pyrophosphate-binding protein [Pseudogulbenkiania subflava]|uniref:Acetolactate synthase-1/2/3 large subunit n=1 Tax=Pseudogulbenkiania subflava DSM 22618 TaxID=1123014 RepID=A0A1Y6C5M5_9NEIS|nr:thiamine pyrophosphate-binding protein [Pseudogulbenkiania subflava]SMF43307.1 acetolactate synthase-1/2/3 large subunit [Pseudogulbenkiania subflava DSM 22618]
MQDIEAPRNGGRILVESLVKNGVEAVYCVPGESYLPVLDALRDEQGVRTVVTRHEGAASYMADAYGKLTGRPGICFVTRGPGATHASNGVHTAMQDSTPMILFIGQVERGFLGREAFQEVDYVRMFGGLAKWVTQIDSIERIPEVVARAFSVAMSGRPGPVVVALPDDILFSTGVAGPSVSARPVQAAPAPAGMSELHRLLSAAQRPLLVVGGSGWSAEACQALHRFAAANALPVATAFRRQDLFDNDDPHYVGHLGFGLSPQLAERVRDADLILAIGTRLGEVTSNGYSLIASPQPAQTLIHVHADPEELGRVYHARLPINAGMQAFARALAELPPLDGNAWRQWTHDARAEYLAFSTPPATSPEHRGVDMGKVMTHLREVLPADAIVSNGAGNYAVWVHRFYRYRRPATELAPTNGAMGYGLPAAIAAKLQHPERQVVCFAGDGCFMMYPQELATARQFGAAVVVIVVNNGMYGTIRMHQEREYPSRPFATDLQNPDFVALAQALGAHAEAVGRSEDFPAAFARATQAGRPALIELKVDPRQITPQARLA